MGLFFNSPLIKEIGNTAGFLKFGFSGTWGFEMERELAERIRRFYCLRRFALREPISS